MIADLTDQELRAGFSLGPWAVQVNQHLIDDGHNTIHLEPKVMEVLCFLAQHQDEVVSREELIAEVWKGTYVSDEVLSRAISILRHQLGDDRKNASYIVTVPKAGYRLIMPVILQQPGSLHQLGTLHQTPPAVPIKAHSPFIRIAALGAAISLMAGILFLLTQRPPQTADPYSPSAFEDLSDWFKFIIAGQPPPEIVTEIAVLPFDDISEQPGNAFVSDGLTDEIIHSLSKVNGLKVVARSSSLSLRNRHEDVRAIGEFLRVQAVIEGTVKRSGERIRISCQLSSTRDGYVLWSETYDRKLDDLLLLQQEISQSIVSALREKLALTELRPPVVEEPQPDMEAYHLYLNGRFLWKLRGELPLRKSMALYQQALALDPAFTRAQLGLANDYISLPFYSSEDEEKMYGAALAILDQLAFTTPAEAGEAEAIKGFIALRRWRWMEAEDYFRKALVLAPNNPNLYIAYSQLLAAVGRTEDTLKAALQAKELDSVSPVVNQRLAEAYLWAGDNVRAAEQFAIGAELGFLNQRSEGYLIFLMRMERFAEARLVIKNLYSSSSSNPAWLMDNIQAISTQSGGDDLVEAAAKAVEDGAILPRIQTGLWLLLDEPERVYETVNSLKGQKKYLDFELLFSQEAEKFRDSDEFSQLVEENGLNLYWARYKKADASW